MLSPETPRMLVVRHPTYRHDFYQVIDNWIRHFGGPHAGLLDVRDLPLDLNPQQQGGQPYGAMVPWLQDPVQHWSPECYAQTLALQQQCDARQIPVLNRVERLAHAGKARGAELMQSVGLRVPRMALITDPQEFRETLLGVPLPLFVREDWGHRGPVYPATAILACRQGECLPRSSHVPNAACQNSDIAPAIGPQLLYHCPTFGNRLYSIKTRDATNLPTGQAPAPATVPLTPGR